jgi:hypothetical protein
MEDSPSVRVAGLRVTVVEATSAVVMCAVENSVHALWLVTCRGAAHFVISITSAGRDEYTIRLLPVECHGRAIRGSQIVLAIRFRSLESTSWSLREVVAPARLVIDDGDETCCIGTKLILGSGIGDTASRQRRNVGSGTVRATLDLVERSSECTVQSSSGTVSGNARCSARCVEVAWSCSSRDRTDKG